MALETEYPDKKLDMEFTDLVAVNITENGKLVGIFELKAYRLGTIMFLGVMGGRFMNEAESKEYEEKYKEELKHIREQDQSGEGWKKGKPE